MNLYLLTQYVNNDYDTYDSCVVAAADEESARRTHPGREKSAWDDDYYARKTWARPHEVTVSLIGTAKEGTAAGVVLASFNAG